MTEQSLPMPAPIAPPAMGYVCHAPSSARQCLICGQSGQALGAIALVQHGKVVCQPCIQQIQGLMQSSVLQAFAD